VSIFKTFRPQSDAEVIILSPEMRQTYSTNYEKFGFKNAANVRGRLTLSAPTGGAHNTHKICIPEKS